MTTRLTKHRSQSHLPSTQVLGDQTDSSFSLSYDQPLSVLYEAPQWTSEDDSDSIANSSSPTLNYCSPGSDAEEKESTEFSLQFNYHQVPPCTQISTPIIPSPRLPIVETKSTQDSDAYFISNYVKRNSGRSVDHRRSASAPISMSVHSFAHFDLFEDGEAYCTYADNSEFKFNPTSVIKPELTSIVEEESTPVVSNTDSLNLELTSEAYEVSFNQMTPLSSETNNFLAVPTISPETTNLLTVPIISPETNKLLTIPTISLSPEINDSLPVNNDPSSPVSSQSPCETELINPTTTTSTSHSKKKRLSKFIKGMFN